MPGVCYRPFAPRRTSLKFELLGAARDCAPGKTVADSDIVSRRILSVRQKVSLDLGAGFGAKITGRST